MCIRVYPQVPQSCCRKRRRGAFDFRIAVGGGATEPTVLESAVEEDDTFTTTGGHGCGIEDGGCVAVVEDEVETVNDSFEEAIYAVGAGELEERAEYLRRAKGTRDRGKRGGVEIM